MGEQARSFSELKIEIIKRMRELADKKLEAERIFLTKEDEALILTAKISDIGDKLFEKIINEGVRSSFPFLFGMRITWDAEETRVLPGEEYETK